MSNSAARHRSDTARSNHPKRLGEKTPLTLGFLAILNLSTLDGTNGFRLDGAAAEGWSGFRVAGAGDLNGDGVSDLIIGAPNATPGGIKGAGSSYVFFGKRGGFPASFDLANLNGETGFRIDGVMPDEASGSSVASAGDVNGDGLADIVIGAPKSGSIGRDQAGAAYVVFGH